MGLDRKWTPGPWVAEKGTTTGAMVVAPNANKAKRAVCRNGGPDRSANANLIAAAPDLYEALEMLRVQYSLFTGPDDYIAIAALSQVDAALAKARGEA